jgi:hypothetical protein
MASRGMERIRAGHNERRLGWEKMKYHDKEEGTERRGAERATTEVNDRATVLRLLCGQHSTAGWGWGWNLTHLEGELR